jgi:hypothetical protein
VPASTFLGGLRKLYDLGAILFERQHFDRRSMPGCSLASERFRFWLALADVMFHWSVVLPSIGKLA